MTKATKKIAVSASSSATATAVETKPIFKNLGYKKSDIVKMGLTGKQKLKQKFAANAEDKRVIFSITDIHERFPKREEAQIWCKMLNVKMSSWTLKDIFSNLTEKEEARQKLNGKRWTFFLYESCLGRYCKNRKKA